MFTLNEDVKADLYNIPQLPQLTEPEEFISLTSLDTRTRELLRFGRRAAVKALDKPLKESNEAIKEYGSLGLQNPTQLKKFEHELWDGSPGNSYPEFRKRLQRAYDRAVASIDAVSAAARANKLDDLPRPLATPVQTLFSKIENAQCAAAAGKNTLDFAAETLERIDQELRYESEMTKIQPAVAVRGPSMGAMRRFAQEWINRFEKEIDPLIQRVEELLQRQSLERAGSKTPQRRGGERSSSPLSVGSSKKRGQRLGP
jgi:hypothetical protein